LALFIPIIQLTHIILDLYWYVVVGAVIMSWLVVTGVINSHNKIVFMLESLLTRMTEPVFMRIRRYLPAMGGIDLSAMIVLLALWLLHRYLELLVVWMMAN
jgi:YggT family protein